MSKQLEQNKTKIILNQKANDFLSLGLSKNKLNMFLKLAEMDFRNRILPDVPKGQEAKYLKDYIDLLGVMARLNLVPDIVNQKAFVILQGGKLTLQVGYKGYLELANKAGYHFTTNIINSNDTYNIDLANTTITHSPNLLDAGNFIAVYVLIKKDGDAWLEVMTKKEVDKIKGTTKSKAWDNYYGEMAKKVVIKRTIKRLDLSGTALDVADTADTSLAGYYDEPKDVAEVVEVLDAKKTQTTELTSDNFDDDFEENRRQDDINKNNEDGEF
jgi:phage RecT family recombinase